MLAHNEEDKMKIELTVPEVNAVLQALGAQPYVQVVALIENIRTQAQQQIDFQEQSPHG